MKRTPYFLLALLTVQLFSEESSEPNEQVASNPIVMQRLGRISDSMSRSDRVALLESQMDDVFTGTVRGDFGAKPASARPAIDSYRVFVKADLLLWKQYVGGDDYAFTDTDLGSYIYGPNKHLNFSWGWGARGELGYRLPHDSWDALARYTWFQSRAKNQINAPAGGSIQPLYSEFDFAMPILANAYWKTKLSVLDFEFGKSYFVNRWISCKPFFGLRTAWIKQNMSSLYERFPNASQNTTIDGKNDSWGIGPWGGVTATTYFAKWMNAFFSLGSSLMVSHFDVQSKQTIGSAPSINLKENLTQIAPNLQAALGIGWDMNFNRNRNHFAVRTSYELLYWWRQNQLTYYGTQNASPPPMGRYAEDLAFHGCTLDLLFDF